MSTVPKASLVLVDGVADNALSVRDRGLSYGDGVFETMALQNGAVLALSQHLHRFRRGAEVLGIQPFPEKQLLNDVARLAQFDNGVIKLLLTRGDGGSGYMPVADSMPRRIASASPWMEGPGLDSGRVCLCKTRLGRSPSLAGLKHLNRLEQVLASREIPDDSYLDGLMMDEEGHVIEGIKSNLFAVKGRELLTPDLTMCGVRGVVRAAILMLAADLGLKLTIKPLRLDDLFGSDELFLTNSLIGVRSVTSLVGDASCAWTQQETANRIRNVLVTQSVIP